MVIGAGNPFRHDDGVGPAVVTEIETLHLPGVLVAIHDGDQTGLLDTAAAMDLIVVVDALLCRPGVPGRIRRLTIETLADTPAATSSHALGLTDAVRLGKALGRLPEELIVIAVEVACLDLGVGMSEPVSAAVPAAVAAVLAELSRVGVETSAASSPPEQVDHAGYYPPAAASVASG
ncbi:hydrogenase maturation protease [Nocardia pseudobrasiliensis]|uniref:Hydrogenase maturation protease n=1 Tax=Nocardia pseudobrasiliensis TaxID=45979 RepID=A0A370IC78_9NOCA|nr:hydrogenase maturation protease [Nocardia pseudobrasiliensis]RDI68329.1 hydrogenase maturation protease [Nocardia pseudobrasiliensis]